MPQRSQPSTKLCGELPSAALQHRPRPTGCVELEGAVDVRDRELLEVAKVHDLGLGSIEHRVDRGPEHGLLLGTMEGVKHRALGSGVVEHPVCRQLIPPLAQRVEALVPRDLDEPGAELGISSEGHQLLVGPEQGVLGNLRGQLRVLEPLRTDGVDQILVSGEQRVNLSDELIGIGAYGPLG